MRSTINVAPGALFSVEGGDAGAQSLLDVPDDVSVVGFDDTDLMRFTDPPLTTVRQPVQQIADVATSLLVAQITGQRVEQREVLVHGELIGRASTAGLAVAAAI